MGVHHNDAQPGAIVFVTGASRSGTTLLSRVLGNHSTILGLNELQYFGELRNVDDCTDILSDTECSRLAAVLLARQARDFWTDGPTREERRCAAELVAEWPPASRTGAGVYARTVAWLAAQAGKTRVSEQTPRNIFYARRLLELYPEARVVHMVRDPRAVLASQKNRWQMRRLGGKNVPISEVVRLWFNYHPVTMSRLWSGATDAALALESHPRVRLLRFEDLVDDPEQTVRDLCDWLELDFEPGMLDVPQWGSSNIRHESAGRGVSQAMVAKWKEVLNPGEIRISERLTAKHLDRFGYARVNPDGSVASTLMMMLVRYPVHVAGVLLSNPKRAWIQLRAVLRSGRETASD